MAGASAPKLTRLTVLVVVGVLASSCGRLAERRLLPEPTTTTPVVSAPPPTSSVGAVPTTSAAPETAAAPVAAEVHPAVTPRGTTGDETLTMPDGTERTYHVYVPASLPAGVAVPLLVALHGGTGWGTQFEENSGFDGLAEANGFVVVYPDGTPIGIGEGRVWNGGACCGQARQDRDDVDDVGFISALITALKQRFDIDPSRVYATGHSNGAIMSYRLACELSDTVVAVGFQAGSLEIPRCAPDRPVSVFHLHGLADTNLPIDGGFGEGISNTDFTSPRESVALLAGLDGCPDPVDSTDPDNPDVSYRVWEPCDEGTSVEFVTVAGANHAWMGHPGTAVQRAMVGEPYPDLDAGLAIWTFLARHPRVEG